MGEIARSRSGSSSQSYNPNMGCGVYFLVVTEYPPRYNVRIRKLTTAVSCWFLEDVEGRSVNELDRFSVHFHIVLSWSSAPISGEDAMTAYVVWVFLEG